MNFIGVATLTQSDNIMKLKPTTPIVGIKKIIDYSFLKELKGLKNLNISEDISFPLMLLGGFAKQLLAQLRIKRVRSEYQYI